MSTRPTTSRLCYESASVVFTSSETTTTQRQIISSKHNRCSLPNVASKFHLRAQNINQELVSTLKNSTCPSSLMTNYSLISSLSLRPSLKRRPVSSESLAPSTTIINRISIRCKYVEFSRIRQPLSNTTTLRLSRAAIGASGRASMKDNNNYSNRHAR